MPLESKAQQRFMFAKHPKIAKRWAAETPNIKGLPERVRSERGGEQGPVAYGNARKHMALPSGVSKSAASILAGKGKNRG